MSGVVVLRLKEVNMSAKLDAKKQIVEEIKGKIQSSKSVVLADYNKLTVLVLYNVSGKCPFSKE